MSIAVAGAFTLILVISIVSMWGRFRRGDSGIREWMLKVPDLDGLCSDYLDYILQMDDPFHDTETLRYLDSQRQVTHNQLLDQLGLDRSYPLDMEEFAKRYLERGDE